MPTRFPLALRLLHWSMAALIVAMLLIGVGMVSTAGPAYALLLALHRPVGLALLGLVTLRLLLRLAQPAPPLPADLPRAQAVLARASHGLLYVFMFAMPLVGWGMLSAGGYPVQIAPGVVLPPIAPQHLHLFGGLRRAHELIAYAFFLLVLAHMAAALVHALIRRDGVFDAMAFGRPRSDEEPEAGASALSDSQTVPISPARPETEAEADDVQPAVKASPDALPRS